MEEEKQLQAQAVVDCLLRRSLFGSNEPLPCGETDWTLVFDEAVAQTVVACAFDGIPKEESIPPEVYNRFRSAAMAVVFKQSVFSAAVAKLDSVLSEVGIEYAVIKGLANAAFYPKPELRMQGDIDFLVDPSNHERAQAQLLANGFKSLESGSDFHLRFSYGGTQLEMHRAIGGVPDTKAGIDFEKALLAGLKSTKRCSNGLCSFCTLQPAFEAAVTLVHMHDHLMSTSTSLRHLCDFLLVSAQLDSAGVEQLKNYGICKAYNLYSKISQKVFGLSAPGAENDNCFSENDMETVLGYFRNGGHFGRKYEGYQGGSLVTGAGGKKQSFAGGVAEYVKNALPFCRRHPILLPLGFLICCFKYLCLIASGKRKKFSVKQVSKNFSEKTDIFQKIDLFSDVDNRNL